MDRVLASEASGGSSNLLKPTSIFAFMQFIAIPLLLITHKPSTYLILTQTSMRTTTLPIFLGSDRPWLTYSQRYSSVTCAGLQYKRSDIFRSLRRATAFSNCTVMQLLNFLARCTRRLSLDVWGLTPCQTFYSHSACFTVVLYQPPLYVSTSSPAILLAIFAVLFISIVLGVFLWGDDSESVEDAAAAQGRANIAAETRAAAKLAAADAAKKAAVKKIEDELPVWLSEQRALLASFRRGKRILHSVVDPADPAERLIKHRARMSAIRKSARYTR